MDEKEKSNIERLRNDIDREFSSFEKAQIIFALAWFAVSRRAHRIIEPLKKGFTSIKARLLI
jgi:hypothetical protein